MPAQQRKPAATDRFLRVADAGTQAQLQKAQQAAVAKAAPAREELAKPEGVSGREAVKVGNDAMKGRLAATEQKRDAIIRFVAERLAVLRQSQLAEAEAIHQQRVWFDEVGRGKTGFGLPDPRRWRLPASLYRKALEAIASGNLARAGDLVDQAVEAERAAFRSVPTQVDLPDGARSADRPPDERPFIGAGTSCGPRHETELVNVAQTIERWSDHAEPVLTPPSAEKTWFEKEPEADGRKDDAKKDAKKAAAESSKPSRGKKKKADG